MNDYERFLSRLVDDLFNEAYGQKLSWKDFAKTSNLSYSTIVRLGTRVTRFPRLDTIFKIARALGKVIEIKKRIKRKLRKAA